MFKFIEVKGFCVACGIEVDKTWPYGSRKRCEQCAEVARRRACRKAGRKYMNKKRRDQNDH